MLRGSPPAFLLAVLAALVWASSGFLFGLDDTWQLVINTGTTIVTFLMAFPSRTHRKQNTQKGHSRVLQMKLDELIVYTKGAHNELLAVEDLSDAETDLPSERLHGRERARMNGDVELSPARGGDDPSRQSSARGLEP